MGKTGNLSRVDLARVAEFVQANLQHDISIKDLASLLNLSSSHFSRTFKATTGISPYQFVQEQRVGRALSLLKGAASIAEIAQSVGLPDQSRFTAVFRRAIGHTPAMARRQMQTR
jgi:AraC family transcriptional regulator